MPRYQHRLQKGTRLRTRYIIITCDQLATYLPTHVLFITSVDSDKSRLRSIGSIGRSDSCSYQGFSSAPPTVPTLHHWQAAPHRRLRNFLSPFCGKTPSGTRIWIFRDYCYVLRHCLSVQFKCLCHTHDWISGRNGTMLLGTQSILTFSSIIFSQVFIHTMQTSLLRSERGRTRDSSGVAIA